MIHDIIHRLQTEFPLKCRDRTICIDEECSIDFILIKTYVTGCHKMPNALLKAAFKSRSGSSVIGVGAAVGGSDVCVRFSLNEELHRMTLGKCSKNCNKEYFIRKLMFISKCHF